MVHSTLLLRTLGALILFLNLTPHSWAQNYNPDNIKAPDVVKWQLASAVEDADGQVKVIAYLSTEQGFSLYQEKTTIASDVGYNLKEVKAPGTQEITDPVTKKPVYVYEEGEFTFIFQKPADYQGESPENFIVSIRYIACTDKICLFPYTEKIAIQLVKPESTSVGIDEGASTETTSDTTTSTGTATNGEEDFESRLANKLKNSDSFLLILLIVFLGGLLTNLTPCVMPMLPITMRILSGQHKSPYKSSIAYASGILVTYTLLGTISASTGGFFGSLLASKSFNIFFAIMMFIFGMTMLGFGNLTKLQTLGGRFGTGAPSLKNAFFMGAGAGLVAAPCTGPILALLLAITAQSGEIVKGSFLMFIYSFGFALPYVFLGRASASVHKIKAPPQVQLGVKLLFAGVMFTLGLYYLRIPLYSVLQSLDAIWQPLYLVCLPLGLIFLAVILFKDSLHNRKFLQIIPPMLIALALFGFIRHQYVKERKAVKDSGLVWLKTEAEAFAAAKAQNKPILIDNWAEWCEACKKMDITTFAEPEVIKELTSRWVVLKLDLTESNDENDAIMERYELASLPTLVMIPADGNLERKELIAGYVNGPTLLNRLRDFLEREK